MRGLPLFGADITSKRDFELIADQSSGCGVELDDLQLSSVASSPLFRSLQQRIFNILVHGSRRRWNAPGGFAHLAFGDILPVDERLTEAWILGNQSHAITVAFARFNIEV